jgi:hypothetical protein
MVCGVTCGVLPAYAGALPCSPKSKSLLLLPMSAESGLFKALQAERFRKFLQFFLLAGNSDRRRNRRLLGVIEFDLGLGERASRKDLPAAWQHPREPIECPGGSEAGAINSRDPLYRDGHRNGCPIAACRRLQARLPKLTRNGG